MTAKTSKFIGAYVAPEMDRWYWRTASGLEVDVVMGDMSVAVEVKGSARVHDGDGLGLRALREEHRVKHAIVVCREREPRKTADGIQVWPWQMFLDRLWSGNLIR